MIRINLLPTRRRRRAFAPESGVIGIVMMVLAALVLSYLYGEVRNTRVKVETEQINRQVVAIRPKVAEILQIEEQIQELRAKEQLLKSLEARQLPWAEVLADLAQRTPRDAWLSSATFSPTSASQLILSGSAFSYDAVGRFMKNLAGSRFYSDVDLQQASKASERVIRFDLGVTLRAAPVAAQGGAR